MAHHYYHHQHPSAVSSTSGPSLTHRDRAPIPPTRHHRAAPPSPNPPARVRRTSTHPPPPKSAPTPTHTADPLLAPSPSHHAPLEYDVALPPSHIMAVHLSPDSRTAYAPLSSRDFAQPATYPPVSHLRITCPRLRWPITGLDGTNLPFSPISERVRPYQNTSVVTVGDVLLALHHDLRALVHAEEWATLDLDVQGEVRAAYKRRCRRSCREDRMYEEQRGLRRVDWLGRYTSFRGLVWGDGGWEMRLGPGERSVKFAL